MTRLRRWRFSRVAAAMPPMQYERRDACESTRPTVPYQVAKPSATRDTMNDGRVGVHALMCDMTLCDRKVPTARTTVLSGMWRSLY